MPLLGAGWFVWRGLGLFLGDLLRSACRCASSSCKALARAAACSSATFASASACTAWASAAFFRSLSAFARSHSGFPGGSRPVWLLTPSIMMLATFLLSPMTTAF